METIVAQDADQKTKEVVQDTGSAFASTEKASKDSESHYKEQVLAAKEELRVLLAHMRGEAADEEEWGKRLKDEIAGESADAHQAAILNAQSRLEQEAAINTRFRQISSLVQGDVHELDASKQAMMQKLTDAAQAEFLRVSQSTEMTKTEMKDRMNKVEAFLVGQLQSIMDGAGSAETTFNDATEQAEAFEREAASRLAAFNAKMEQEDAAIGVVL